MGEIVTRTFQTAKLIEWDIHQWECEHVVHKEERRSTRRVVFRSPDDGQFWRLDYEYDNEAFIDELVGRGTYASPTPERSQLEATLVQERKVVQSVYEPLCKGQEPATSVHVTGRLLEIGDMDECRGALVELSVADIQTIGALGCLYANVDIIATGKPA